MKNKKNFKKRIKFASSFYRWMKRHFRLLEDWQGTFFEEGIGITWREVWYYCLRLVFQGRVKRTFLGYQIQSEVV